MDTKLIEVILPLKVELLKEFIEAKGSQKYICNYAKNELKGSVLYNYISNLNLPVEFDFKDCSFNQKEEALKSYMETRNIIDCESLRLNVAAVILHARGFLVENIFQNLILNKEERTLFFNNNQELCYKWEQFIESTMIFAQKSFHIANREDENELFEHNFEVVDDILYVGANIVKMFSIPSFLEIFFLANARTELKYFKQQFDEYIFRGKNFFEFYFCEENQIFQLFLANASGLIKSEDMFRVHDYTSSILAP